MAEAEAKGKDKVKGKPAATTQIETLNSPSAAQTHVVEATSANPEQGQEEDTIHEATPEMIEFAKLPSSIPPGFSMEASQLPPSFPIKALNMDAFEKAYEFLKAHPRLVKGQSNQAVDSLLLTAFESQGKAQDDLARRSVEKALLLQYCNKLGPDGVRLFFQRMTQTGGQAAVLFLNDVLSTYARIRSRSAQLAAEASAGKEEEEEQIQLVAEDPNTKIGFSVPEGPPPEKIELEGEGFENVTPEMVREMLQKQWDIFTSFSPEFQDALKTQDLDKVNAQLGSMPLEVAEKTVEKLDESGILNFSSNEIRDETGK